MADLWKMELQSAFPVALESPVPVALELLLRLCSLNICHLGCAPGLLLGTGVPSTAAPLSLTWLTDDNTTSRQVEVDSISQVGELIFDVSP